MKGIIKALSISKEKGTQKNNVGSVVLREDYGIIGDAHAGSNRQVSLLAEESIEKMRTKGLSVKQGDFAENITTEGIDLLSLAIGDKLKIGGNVLLEVSHIGKECKNRCAVYYRAGDCVMPKEGIFARVVKGGVIRCADVLEIVRDAG